ncbi:MAG: carboxypeptidase-like regulatory domain-containing protein [Bacteroidota bacterium]
MFLVTFMLSLNIQAQPEPLTGKILSEKGEPLEYVHIQLENSSLGTITNSYGDFKLYIPKSANPVINVSFIGYKTKRIEIKEANQIIYLQEDVKQLQNVVITPWDYASELVENAIKRIPENYANRSEKHIGFFREYASWGDSTKFDPIYVAESTIEAIKRSYDRVQKKGVVRLLESRKFSKSNLDSLRTEFYSGPHKLFSFDVVANRYAFLGKPKKYSYRIIDTLKVNGGHLFKVSFEKKNEYSGFIYIADLSYAITKIEFIRTQYPNINLENRGRKYQDFYISYEKGEDKKWRLKNVVYNTGFNRHSQDFTLKREYVTTEVSSDTNPIPYEERIHFNDIYLKNTAEYDPDFWEGQNIILPEPKIDSLFKLPPHLKKEDTEIELIEKKQRIADIYSRLSLSYGVAYSPFQIANYDLIYGNPQFELVESSQNKSRSSVAISAGISYRTGPHYVVSLRSVQALTKHRINSIDLELGRIINLNPGGRPIVLVPKIQLGEQRVKYSLCSIDSENIFRVDNKEFDSGKTNLFIEQRGIRLQPMISLEIEKNPKYRFVFSAGYNFMLSQKSGLYFDETDQFFLKQKNAFLRNGKEGLSIISSDDVLRNQWNFSLTIKVRAF